ncbi:MAG: hypothetical protein LBE27_02185 [Deltaproteobacteria bacterium]|jgi:hypothetical protein|nr:hypothetical protein [Deltaproteobacteria bacterium]
MPKRKIDADKSLLCVNALPLVENVWGCLRDLLMKIFSMKELARLLLSLGVEDALATLKGIRNTFLLRLRHLKGGAFFVTTLRT